MSKEESSKSVITVQPIEFNILAQRISALFPVLNSLNQKLDAISDSINQLTSIIKEASDKLQGELECIHINGSAGTSPSSVWDVEPVVVFFIHNTHDTNDLFVSFDGGTRFKKISAGDAIGLSGWPTYKIRFSGGVKVKASADNTSYEILILR